MGKDIHYDLIKDHLNKFYDLLAPMVEHMDRSKVTSFMLTVCPSFRGSDFDKQMIERLI
jgi:hypothetical protein